MAGFLEHYNQLKGLTVVDVVQDGNKGNDQCWGLQMSNGKIAWIMCDPEGNGPGFLSIEEDVDTPKK